MDAGSGTCSALQEFIDPLELDAVVLSHVHPDHCIDLLAYFHLACYGPRIREEIPVLAADLIEQRMCAFIDAGPDHAFRRTFAFRTVSGGDIVLVGDIELAFANTEHPVPTVATRATWRGRSLVYTADTGPSPAVTALAAGVDVLLAEAAYQGTEKPWPHHMTAFEAGDMGAQAGAQRLILTHIGPAFDPNRSLIDAESTFGAPVRLAIPGSTISI